MAVFNTNQLLLRWTSATSEILKCVVDAGEETTLLPSRYQVCPKMIARVAAQRSQTRPQALVTKKPVQCPARPTGCIIQLPSPALWLSFQVLHFDAFQLLTFWQVQHW